MSKISEKKEKDLDEFKDQFGKPQEDGKTEDDSKEELPIEELPIGESKEPEKETKTEEGKKDKPIEEETEEQTEEIQIPSGINFPAKPVMYAGIGIAVVALLLLLFARKNKKGKETIATETDISMKSEVTQASDMKEKADKKKSIASVHEIGAREDQQDSFGSSEEVKGTLLVVADGMGGLNNGGQISSLAVTTALNLFRQLPEHMSSPDMLLEMAGRVNYSVNQFLRGKQRGGSTLVTSIVRNGYLHFLTIGDSRIYLYRNGALIQLNREHIYKEELALEAVNGMMPVGRIHADAQAKSLTSYLGDGRIAHLDRNLEGIRLIDGDRIIMMSDGVFGTLIPEQMEEALALPLEEAAKRIKELVRMADKAHQDNYTALMYEYKN